MAGYTRQDVSNNISNGSVIDADDLDNEFDAVAAAFDPSTGHSHSGVAGEGGPINVVGPVQEYVASSVSLAPKGNNLYDLGASAQRWKNLWVAGTSTLSNVDITGSISLSGTVDGRDVATDGSKLDGIEASADVTDATNVEAAGALMDSEVTNLAAVKAFDPADYATAAQGSLADTATQPGDNVSTLTNDAGYTTNAGTVTSVDLIEGTGISVSGGPVTSSGSITVTNTAPDQTVVLTEGANVTITGTYPNFTIAATNTNTTYTAGSGLDLTGTTFSIDSTVATLTGTQTLTNKTLTTPAISTPTMTGTIIEDVAIFGTGGGTAALEPDTGSVWVLSLLANTIFSDGFTSGQAITLMLDDGLGYTVTWPTMTWVNNGGIAPTLATTGYTTVALWKAGATLYGALVGDGS